MKAGRRVPVLGDWEVQRGAPVNLLYRANHRRTPRVKAFIDELTQLLRDFDAAGGTVMADRPKWYPRGYGRASASARMRG